MSQILSSILPIPDMADMTNLSTTFLTGRTAAFADFVRTYDSVPMAAASPGRAFPGIVTRSASGALIPDFSDQYMDAVHISPQLISLGNILSTQTVDVEVWNNHRHEMTLSEIAEESTDGIILTEPQAAPTIFQPNEYRTYQVSISTDGPPTIDGIYTFEWGDYSMTLEVTGMRVVVWPFPPKNDYSETIEFLTDIIPVKNGEQRISKRINPRILYSGDYVLTQQKYSRVKALMYQWGFRQFGVPVWAESQYIGAISSGSTEISIDTTSSSYEEGGMLLLWQNDETYESVEIESITDTAITLTLQTAANYTSAYVMPVLFCYIDGELEAKRDYVLYINANVSFVATDTVNVSSDTGKTQLRGKDVYLGPQNISLGIDEKLYTDCATLDNDIGVIAMLPIRDFSEHEQTLSRVLASKADIWEFKRWLYTLNGRQKSFFIPTWNSDIQITADLTAASTSVIIKSIGYALYYGQKDLMIKTVSGEIYFYVISSAIDNGDGTETLYLATQIGAELPTTDIKKACFLSHVRLDSDRIEFDYTNKKIATVSIPIREVPEQ